MCMFSTIIVVTPIIANAETSYIYTYEVSNDEATITDCVTSAYGSITIPSKLGSYPVTHIGNNAFSGCKDVTSITIPNSVTSIGNYAFYNCYSLVNITISDSVTSIGDYAFYYCIGLTSITIPDSVTSIGNYAFRECNNLTGIVIPDGVTSIGYETFYNCYKLTNITLSNSVTTIGYEAFGGCDSLASITIPDSVTSIGAYAFRECNNLTGIVIPDGVTSIGAYAFYNCDSLASITLPDSITYIGDSAFCDTSFYINSSNWEEDTLYIGKYLIKAKKIMADEYVIKEDIKLIAGGAFSGCDSLASITIPNSVTSIGDYAFYNCKDLTDVYYFGSEEQWENISIFTYNDYLTKANIHYDVSKINYIINEKNDIFKTAAAIPGEKFALTNDIPIRINYTFLGWATASSSETAEYQPGDTITVGTDDITLYAVWKSNYEYEISNGKATITKFKTAVSGSITIPSTFEDYPVTSVGVRAFNGCNKLTSITLPDSVTDISDLAFYGCSNLKNISIPQSVTSIGNGAFYGCTSLTDVYYGARKEQWENIAVGSNNDCLINANIYVSEIDINYVIDNSNNVWKMVAVKSSVDATVINDTPSRTGYAFLGWATTADAKTAQYQPCDTITVSNENITLYAVWKKIVYTDTVRADDIFIITPVGVPDGSSIIIACYKNDALVYTEKYNYDGRTEIPIIIDAEYDRVRVFVWNSIGGMIPITEAEDINL